jgi:hypothetical protein
MLTPLGARRLIGFPLEEVGDRLIDPTDLFGSAARETIEQLQETNSHAGRLAILEQLMMRRLILSRNQIPRDLIWALSRLKRLFLYGDDDVGSFVIVSHLIGCLSPDLAFRAQEVA